MPTSRNRFTVTEVGPVADALAELRRELGDPRIDAAELFVLGAREKVRLEHARRTDAERRRELRRRFVDRSLSADGLDGEAALVARDRAWEHE